MTESLKENIIGYMEAARNFTAADIYGLSGIPKDEVRSWIEAQCPEFLPKLVGAVKKETKDMPHNPHAFGYRKPVEVQVEAAPEREIIEKKEETKDRLQEILEHYGVSYLELADAVAYYKHQRPLTLSDINDLEAFVMDLLRNNTLIDMEGVARALKISKIRLIELVKSSEKLKRAFNEHLNVKYGMSMDWFV